MGAPKHAFRRNSLDRIESIRRYPRGNGGLRLEKMEVRFAKSLDDLTKTLDKFLKRLTDIEEEFTFMKEDLKRVKAVIREKLGVSLD